MSGASSVDSITKAVKTVDRGARVRIDLVMHHVEIEPVVAEAHEFTDAISDVGYTPVRRWPSELLL
jgi:copper chaperone